MTWRHPVPFRSGARIHLSALGDHYGPKKARSSLCGFARFREENVDPYALPNCQRCIEIEAGIARANH